MKHPRVLFISILGIGSVVAGLMFHSHIVEARTARLSQIAVPAPYFPPGSVWTQDARLQPLDAKSSTITSWLADQGGWGTGRMQVDFSFRVLQVDSTTPSVPFRNITGSVPVDSDTVSSFPLPRAGGIEGQPDYHCSIDLHDCHLLVVDRSRNKLYEAYQANEVGDVLTASLVAIWDLNRVYPPSGRGDQCSSADAAGFPIAPLLFNADELATGSINHAIRFILPNEKMQTRVFVHPATHAGGPSGPASAPPYGAHLRLKASYDLSGLKPAAQIVARALQRYGMYLSDGGEVALTAQSDEDTTAKYADVDFKSRDLQSLKVTDFEVIDGGTRIPLTYDCVRNP
jgi:hypothetical protein